MIVCLFVHEHVCFVLQHGKSGLCGFKPQQNWGHADQNAKQPGGHRDAKSTSKRRTRIYTHTPGPDSPFTRQIQTHTHWPTCCWAHTEKEAFMRPTSNTQAHLHTDARRHPFPLPTIKVKSRQQGEGGCVCVRRWEGGTNRIGKKQWRFFPLVNDFPFMKLREGSISIQPCWSLHDSIGKWPAVIKQCGGKNTEEYSEEKLTFFYCVELHKSQQITKREKNQKYSSAPSVLQNSRAWGTAHPTFVSCGMARWLTGYDERWYLLKF